MLKKIYTFASTLFTKKSSLTITTRRKIYFSHQL